MGRPQGPEGLIGAASGVLAQRLQGILLRFPAVMAVLGRDKVDPSRRGASERLV